MSCAGIVNYKSWYVIIRMFSYHLTLLYIGLNTSPSDSFVSYLNSHLGYSAGEFQALQLIVLAVFGAVD